MKNLFSFVSFRKNTRRCWKFFRFLYFLNPEIFLVIATLTVILTFSTYSWINFWYFSFPLLNILVSSISFLAELYHIPISHILTMIMWLFNPYLYFLCDGNILARISLHHRQWILPRHSCRRDVTSPSGCCHSRSRSSYLICGCKFLLKYGMHLFFRRPWRNIFSISFYFIVWSVYGIFRLPH